MRYLTILALAVLSLIAACTSQEVKNIKPIFAHASDPFLETMIKPQIFTVQTDKDTVISGAQGSVIYLPPNAFVDKNGNPVIDNVSIELAEGFTIKDMLLSNLTTSSNGEPLISDGMIYINATANGEDVFVNPESKPYVQIPTKKRQDGMMLYQGERDFMGNMNWTNPKPFDNFLVPVDLSELDFMPSGFEDTLKASLPAFNHSDYSHQLRDSLYLTLPEPGNEGWGEYQEFSDEDYLEPGMKSGFGNYGNDSLIYPNLDFSLDHKLISEDTYEIELNISFPDDFHLIAFPKESQDDLKLVDDYLAKNLLGLTVETNNSGAYEVIEPWQIPEPKETMLSISDSPIFSITEPIKITQRLKVRNKKAAIIIYFEGQLASDGYAFPFNSLWFAEHLSDQCGISPERILALKNPEFESSLIATKAFEERMEWIHKSCNNKVLDVYLNNLGKNLWELDSMAAEIAEDEKVKEAFQALAKLKQANVKNAGKRARFLKRFYQRKLKALTQKLEEQKAVALEIRAEEVATIKKAKQEYRKVLVEREIYRMETYGFELSSMGWKNVDVGVVPKLRGNYRHELTVNGRTVDQAFSWLILKEIKSLHRMKKQSASSFLAGSDGMLLVPKNEKAVFVYLGFENGDTLFGMKQVYTGADLNVELNTKLVSSVQFDSIMNSFDAFSTIDANSIAIDLTHNLKLYELAQKEKKRAKDWKVIKKLQKIGYPCCQDFEFDGGGLFSDNCAACHKVDRKMIGPALVGVREQWKSRTGSDDAIISYVKNSTSYMKQTQDPYALNLFDEYNKTLMTPMALNSEEVLAIFDWIDRTETK